MPIELKMPALSPTMEEGTLSRWLVKEGDTITSGDILAEIETDKATMEYEAIDEGTIAKLLVPAGTDGVKVGTVIALIAEEGESTDAAPAASAPAAKPAASAAEPASADAPPPEEKGYGASPATDPSPGEVEASPVARSGARSADGGDRVKASPLARRIAEQGGIDLGGISGSGPNGRIVKADLAGASATAPARSDRAPVAPPEVPAPAEAAPAPAAAPAQIPTQAPAAAVPGIPHEVIKLSNMRRTIARRLTESKQQVPHIYLTVDIRLDALLALRGELNAALAPRGVKLSVNDMLIKALAMALVEVPACNVSFAGDQLYQFARADIAVAVSIPGGLITPIVTAADTKSLSAIASEMKDLGGRAKDGKLKPEEYQGGTASLSNMGMFGITQFAAVINPPHAMILAVGAGEKRPWVVDDALAVATVMTVTGSFDHRAIDGADGAQLMAAIKRLVESPLGMIA